MAHILDTVRTRLQEKCIILCRSHCEGSGRRAARRPCGVVPSRNMCILDVLDTLEEG